MSNIDYSSERSDKFLDANVSIVEYESRRVVGANFFSEVDLTQIERIRTREGLTGASRRTPYTAFVVKAVAKALSDFSYANARIFPRFACGLFGRTLVRFKKVDVAVAAERNQPGLEAIAFCDVLRSADQMPLTGISEWLSALANADANSNKQWSDFNRTIKSLPRWLAALMIRMPCYFPSMWTKYRGGSVLVSSPGKYGVDMIGATWVWPLGVSFGVVRERPVVSGGQIIASPTFTLTLSFDRRMLAGAPAARFFRRIVVILENAETELA